MSLAGLLGTTIEALEAEGVPYMITGSIASAFHGEPRATRDIDVVIDPAPASLDGLVARLQAAGAYVDAEAARAALRERTQFNAVADDAKVDFVILRDRPFSSAEFERRRRVRLGDLEAFIVSAEDLIVLKLEWAEATGSERQLRDVEGMIAVAGRDLDRDHIERWTSALGLGDAWRRVLDGLSAD